MAYNYSLLIEKIKKKCGSQAVFSLAMKLSERTISLKLNNKNDWKQREITKACKILDINNEEISKYFFIPEVQD